MTRSGRIGGVLGRGGSPDRFVWFAGTTKGTVSFVWERAAIVPPHAMAATKKSLGILMTV